MQTNQVMHRSMGVYDVQQRTKDGYFNATDLLRQWNESVESGVLNTPNLGDLKKEMWKYFDNKHNITYCRSEPSSAIKRVIT